MKVKLVREINKINMMRIMQNNRKFAYAFRAPLERKLFIFIWEPIRRRVSAKFNKALPDAILVV